METEMEEKRAQYETDWRELGNNFVNGLAGIQQELMDMSQSLESMDEKRKLVEDYLLMAVCLTGQEIGQLLGCYASPVFLGFVVSQLWSFVLSLVFLPLLMAWKLQSDSTLEGKVFLSSMATAQGVLAGYALSGHELDFRPPAPFVFPILAGLILGLGSPVLLQNRRSLLVCILGATTGVHLLSRLLSWSWPSFGFIFWTVGAVSVGFADMQLRLNRPDYNRVFAQIISIFTVLSLNTALTILFH